MALDDLLTMLEQRAVDTPDTPCNPSKESAKPAPILACTPDTADTPQNDKGEIDRKAFEERVALAQIGRRRLVAMAREFGHSLDDLLDWYKDDMEEIGEASIDRGHTIVTEYLRNLTLYLR